MPMRGFLAFFELAQLVKLALISVKTLCVRSDLGFLIPATSADSSSP